MGNRLNLSDEERRRRADAMRALNRSGGRGRRRAKSDEEKVRQSLLRVVQTGSPRQRLDAARQLAALDERAPARPRRDFDTFTDREIEQHLEGLVRRTCEAWFSARVLPEMRVLFERFGHADLFDRVVAERALCDGVTPGDADSAREAAG